MLLELKIMKYFDVKKTHGKNRIQSEFIRKSGLMLKILNADQRVIFD